VRRIVNTAALVRVAGMLRLRDENRCALLIAPLSMTGARGFSGDG